MAQTGRSGHFLSSRSLASFALFVCCVTLRVVNSNANEFRLINNLLGDSRVPRLIASPNLNGTSVTIGLSLWQIIDLDDDRNILEATWWVYLSWKDPMLRWNATEYEGIKVVSIPTKLIWVPDIVPYNQALKADYMVPKEEQLASVTSDGNVRLVPAVTYRTSCAVDKSSKTQKCDLNFGSWTRNGFVIDIFPQDKMKIELVGNFTAKWEVVSTSVERIVKHYACCPEPYPNVVFSLELKKTEKKHHSKREDNAANGAKRTAGNLAIALIVFMNVFCSFK